MKEIIMIRIDYDTKNISQDNIVENIVEMIEYSPVHLKTHITTGLNLEQADRISKTIKKVSK